MQINPPIKKHLGVGKTSVAYIEMGDPAGMPVLLLHGYPNHSFLWRNVMKGMAAFRCLAPDLMGLGDTEPAPDADLSLESQAKMVKGFLEAMKIKRAALVGHDHGGGVAQIIAVKWQESVSHLILVDSVGYDAWPVARVRARAWMARFLPGLSSSPLLMERFWRSRFGLSQAVNNPSVMTPDILEEYIRPLTSSPERRERFRRYLVSCSSKATNEIAEKLRSLSLPAMVVWGEHDRFLPISIGQRLCRDIPACRLEIVQGCGHLVPEEMPDALATLICGFLSPS